MASPRITSERQQIKFLTAPLKHNFSEEPAKVPRRRRRSGKISGVYETKFEVEAVRRHKLEDEEEMYEIKWKDYDESENTWEPRHHLSQYLLIKYWKYVNEMGGSKQEGWIEKEAESSGDEEAGSDHEVMSDDVINEYESDENDNTKTLRASKRMKVEAKQEEDQKQEDGDAEEDDSHGIVKEEVKGETLESKLKSEDPERHEEELVRAKGRDREAAETQAAKAHVPNNTTAEKIALLQREIEKEKQRQRDREKEKEKEKKREREREKQREKEREVAEKEKEREREREMERQREKEHEQRDIHKARRERGKAETVEGIPEGEVTIVVKGVSHACSDSELADFLNLHATGYTRIRYPRDYETGLGKGVGFVTYSDFKMASDALTTLHRKNFLGRILTVSFHRDTPGFVPKRCYICNAPGHCAIECPRNVHSASFDPKTVLEAAKSYDPPNIKTPSSPTATSSQYAPAPLPRSTSSLPDIPGLSASSTTHYPSHSHSSIARGTPNSPNYYENAIAIHHPSYAQVHEPHQLRQSQPRESSSRFSDSEWQPHQLGPETHAHVLHARDRRSPGRRSRERQSPERRLHSHESRSRESPVIGSNPHDALPRDAQSRELQRRDVIHESQPHLESPKKERRSALLGVLPLAPESPRKDANTSCAYEGEIQRAGLKIFSVVGLAYNFLNCPRELNITQKANYNKIMTRFAHDSPLPLVFLASKESDSKTMMDFVAELIENELCGAVPPNAECESTLYIAPLCVIPPHFYKSSNYNPSTTLVVIGKPADSPPLPLPPPRLPLPPPPPSPSPPPTPHILHPMLTSLPLPSFTPNYSSHPHYTSYDYLPPPPPPL